jgi:hypothetical protein
MRAVVVVEVVKIPMMASRLSATQIRIHRAINLSTYGDDQLKAFLVFCLPFSHQ